MSGGPVHRRPHRSHHLPQGAQGHAVCRLAPRPGRADSGEAGAEGSRIETIQITGGARISTIHRPDGSTFTVTVPAAAMDDEVSGGHGPKSWISGDGTEGRAPPAGALLRLATLVALGASSRPARHLDPAALAVR